MTETTVQAEKITLIKKNNEANSNISAYFRFSSSCLLPTRERGNASNDGFPK